jgi:hypothetical protein
MRSAIPPIIKNYLKAAPAVWVSLIFFVGSPILINIYNYRVHQRNPKNWIKSGQFEKSLRVRDSRFRNVVHPSLTYQPGDKKLNKTLID